MKMKKLLSSVISLAMLISTAVPVLADETITTVGNTATIECEDYAASGVTDSDSASGDKYVNVHSGSAYTLDMKVNVETAGDYRLAITSGNRWSPSGNGMATHLSWLSVTVGDKTAKVGGDTVSRSGKLYTGAYGEDVCKFTFYSSFYFKKGENTITLTLPLRDGSSDIAVATLDCVDLELVNAYEITYPTLGEKGGTVECEEFDNHIVSNENASGGKYVKIENGTPPYDVTMKFNVTTAGKYKLEVVSGGYYSWMADSTGTKKGSDARATHLSELDVIIGNDYDNPLSESYSVIKAETGYTGNWNELVSSSNFSAAYGNIHFDEGENAITVRIKKRAAGEGAYAVLDCLKLTLVEPDEVTLPTIGATGTVEIEDFVTSGIVGGKYVQYYGNDKDSYTIETKFNAEEAGVYELALFATSAEKSNGDMSAVSMSVNGGSNIAITTSNVTISDYEYDSTGLPGGKGSSWEIYKQTYNNYIRLNKGTNTITITIPRRSETSGVYSVLDKYTLTKKAALIPTIGVSGGELECEWFADGIVNNSNASNAKYVKIENYGAGATGKVEMKVNMETAGNYKLSITSGDRMTKNAGGDDATQLSWLYVTVGDDERKVGGDTTTRSATLYTGPFGENVNKVTFNETFAFAEGENTITLYMPTRDIGGGAFGTLDCVSLEYADVISEKGARYEFENLSGMSAYVKEATAASKGKYIAFDNEDVNNTEMTMTVRAENAGKYQVKIAAAVRNGDDAASNLSGGVIAANGGDDTYYINAEDCVQVGDIYYLDEAKKYPFAVYYVSAPIELNAGENEITVYGYDGDEETATSAFDYIEFTPVKDLGTITAVNGSVSMNVGDESTITLQNGDGATISASDVYQITYKSSNEEVAKVDGNGKIAAQNGGEATITVYVKENAITDAKTVTVTVTVTDDRDIYISGVNASANGTAYKVVVNNAFDSDLTVYTASYSGKKLISVEKATITAGTTGETPVNAASVVMPSGDNAAVKLFVWNGMTPVLFQTVK